MRWLWLLPCAVMVSVWKVTGSGQTQIPRNSAVGAESTQSCPGYFLPLLLSLLSPDLSALCSSAGAARLLLPSPQVTPGLYSRLRVWASRPCPRPCFEGQASKKKKKEIFAPEFSTAPSLLLCLYLPSRRQTQANLNHSLRNRLPRN